MPPIHPAHRALPYRTSIALSDRRSARLHRRKRILANCRLVVAAWRRDRSALALFAGLFDMNRLILTCFWRRRKNDK